MRHKPPGQIPQNIVITQLPPGDVTLDKIEEIINQASVVSGQTNVFPEGIVAGGESSFEHVIISSGLDVGGGLDADDITAETATASGAIQGLTVSSTSDMFVVDWTYYGNVGVINEYFRIGRVAEDLVTQKLTDTDTWTNVPTGGSMTYKEIVATGQSAGELNLSGVTWSISKAWIDSFTVSIASGDVSDYDIEIYEDDTFTGDPRYKVESALTDWEDETEWSYVDRDDSDEVHLKIIENTGTGTYNITIRGVELV